MKHLILMAVAALIIAIPATTHAQDTQKWRSKKPYEGYWQQDIHYIIRAEIDENTDILSGTEHLTYTNNSPDTLTFVYFHLYQNAFQPGSYANRMNEGNGNVSWFGSKYQQQKLGTTIESLTSSGIELKTEADNTIMKVWLARPLSPGKQAEFDITFKTYFDITAGWGRMRVYDSWGNKHYNGAHFYPRIAVYDSRSGWDTDQHLGHEFYGDFGSYDVSLTFASNFIVDGTGTLLNSAEMLPAALREKLDIINFKDKPLNEEPSVIIPYDSTKHKTWNFHADNVIDFAFVADPTFRIGETTWNGIKCVALVQEPHASRWQDAAGLTARIIQIYSEDFGMYEYPKMIVCDAQSGMEYPMLTMDGGLSPDYTHLLAHEIAHNWFYGMLANNETYQAAMDEGFTQFLTIWAMEKLQKERIVEGHSSGKYVERHSKKYPHRYTAAYLPYFENAITTKGVQLNTHSDMFIAKQNYGSEYRQTYNKTAVMLFNLQYVLGDELFEKTMKNYVSQWKFCHPYLDDFRTSVNNYTNINLNWFFDEWLETNKTTDYAVKCIQKGKTKGEYTITFKRKGSMQMPVDFTLITRNDSAINYHIPNTWFVKKTDANVLPKWTGWNNLNRKYKATVTSADGIKNVIIDTTRRLADVNMTNNAHKRPFELSFDYLIQNSPDITHYEFYGRPELWWNGYDGFKIGFNLDGSYMNYQHVLNLTFWFNTGFVQQKFSNKIYREKFNSFSYRITYSEPLSCISKNTRIQLGALRLDGLQSYKLELEHKTRNRKNRFFINFRSLFRADSNDMNYLLYPDEWSSVPHGKNISVNNSISLGYQHNYSCRTSTGTVSVILRTSAFGSDFDYTSFTAASIHRQQIWRLTLNTRLFAQYALGWDLPKESSLYLAGANPEEMMENKYTRATGFIDRTWLGYGNNTNHFQEGGGLNLRGYAGYLVAQPDREGNLQTVYRGHTGAAVNAELSLGQIVNIRPRYIKDYLGFDVYLFGDAGVISINDIAYDLELADIRADAGAGIALTIKKWGPFEKTKPLTLRFDMPLFLNRTPAESPEYLQFRWLVGVNRAF